MSLDPRKTALLHAMGLGPVWQTRDATPLLQPQLAAADAVAAAEPVAIEQAAGPDRAATAAILADMRGRQAVDAMDWPELARAVADCTACGLCRSRKQTVFGVGHRQARWMIVGEAPGAEEDARGEPFVGQAGRLLDNMLASVGLSRTAEDPQQAVYIANVLKCRPPGNRNPEPPEVSACEPFLMRQVALLQPALIVVMGRFAAQSLLDADASIASLRGRVHRIEVDGRSLPVVVTYHPAYLLRNLADKAKSWADLCLAKSVAAGVSGET